MANNGLKVRLLYLCVGMVLGSVSLALAQSKRMAVEGDLEVEGDIIAPDDEVVIDDDLRINSGLIVGDYYLDLVVVNGKVGLGTASPIETLTIARNLGAIGIKEISSSAPSDDPGYAKIWVDEGELWVMDENDNETQISSHADPRDYGSPATTSFADPQVELPFSFHHANNVLGKGAVVDLAAALHDLEGLTGRNYTTAYDLPASSTEELLDRYAWIEVPLEEAVEQVEIMVPETETQFEFDPDTLQVTQVEIPTGEDSETGTGTYRNQLKDYVRFDKENGKFYRRPTLAEIPQGATPDLPAWIADRLPPLD